MGSHEDQPDVTPIRWYPELRPEILVDDDVIVGFGVLRDLDLDLFTHNVGRSLVELPPLPQLPPLVLSDSGRQTYFGWESGMRPPSEALVPRKFHGDIGDIEVMMTKVTHRTPQDDPFPPRSFFVAAGLFSTGQGRIGTIAKRVDVGVRTYYAGYWQGHRIGPYAGRITVRYKSLPRDTSKETVELLHRTSQLTAHVLAVAAVRHALYGGLPE